MGHNHNDGHTLIKQVLIQPNIGLDSDVRQAVVELLNITLADEIVLATKTRNAHWNVRGADFYELHTLFEIQYQLLNNISDEIAERTRMLGGFAVGSLQEFANSAHLTEIPGVIPDILHLLADHETSIRFLRENTRKCAEEYEDVGTFELLVSIIRLHEKMAWMLRSYIENKLVHGESQERI
jgi:starvation-inducible DNA-binding protein